MKVVIIGGVAGGATAAARMTRLSDKLDITIVERGPDVSFANCGLPYYIGRQIKNRNALKMHTAQSLREMLRVNRVLTLTEATCIDRKRKLVVTRNVATGEIAELPYDKVIYSPGARPFVPPKLGDALKDPRIRTLRNLNDMDKIDEAIHVHKVSSVAVIGAGFIGIEMAEQLQRVGKKVTIVDLSPTVLPQADPEIAQFLHEPLLKRGIDLQLGKSLVSFDTTSPSKIKVILDDPEVDISVEFVIFCIGVTPDTRLAVDCGLDVAARGQIIVNDYMQTDWKSVV